MQSICTESTEMLEWIFDLMQSTELPKHNNLGEILSFAAFSRTNMLQSCLDKLNCRGMLKLSDPKITLKIGGSESGLLAALCYANTDVSKKEIWRHLETLAPSEKCFNFMGTTALHYALNHGNAETSEALLQKEDWRNYFTSFIDESGKNILQYAVKVGTEERIYDIIQQAFHAASNSSFQQN